MTVLVLSTAHSAKGKEWDAVFLIWAVDGWFPSARALDDDEETGGGAAPHVRRADARAKSPSVTYPLNSYSTRRGADYSIDQLSRFIDRGVREKMERRRSEGRWRRRARPEPPPPAPIDLRAHAARPLRGLTIAADLLRMHHRAGACGNYDWADD